MLHHSPPAVALQLLRYTYGFECLVLETLLGKLLDLFFAVQFVFCSAKKTGLKVVVGSAERNVYIRTRTCIVANAHPTLRLPGANVNSIMS